MTIPACRCGHPITTINDMTLCDHCDEPCNDRNCDHCANIKTTA